MDGGGSADMDDSYVVGFGNDSDKDKPAGDGVGGYSEPPPPPPCPQKSGGGGGRRFLVGLPCRLFFLTEVTDHKHNIATCVTGFFCPFHKFHVTL